MVGLHGRTDTQEVLLVNGSNTVSLMSFSGKNTYPLPMMGFPKATNNAVHTAKDDAAEKANLATFDAALIAAQKGDIKTFLGAYATDADIYMNGAPAGKGPKANGAFLKAFVTAFPDLATRLSLERIKDGKDTVSVTRNVLRDYVTCYATPGPRSSLCKRPIRVSTGDGAFGNGSTLQAASIWIRGLRHRYALTCWDNSELTQEWQR